MKNTSKLLSLFIFICFFCSCSRKTTSTSSANKPAETTTAKTASVPKIKTPTPSVIVVNDNAAQKTVDGRYYYDLNKKRYWRNNKDGKYYLFNKSMYTSDDFKPVKAN